MKKRSDPLTALLVLISLICLGALLYFSYHAYQEAAVTEEYLSGAIKSMQEKKGNLEAQRLASAAPSADIVQISPAPPQQTVLPTQEAFPAEEKAEKTNVSSGTEDARTLFDSSSGVYSSGKTISGSYGATEEDGVISPPKSKASAGTADTFSNGHIVGIDPGHQGSNVDMSDLEPLGPGSSEMKAMASTGTQGLYSGLPEYQLNLDVSLKLQSILEDRGYKVIMTRTDNDTAISNKERAEYVAENGAEIYVRIHANGEDSHTASGALGMAPSPDNPYVGELSSQSELLSQCILDSYCEATGFKNLGITYSDNMTGINWSSVPVTILEMGFMTFESDDLQMSDEAFQDTMAEGIADGIDLYFEDAF